MARRLRLVFLLLGALAAPPVIGVACNGADDVGRTSGARVGLGLRALPRAPSLGANALGWSVELTRAQLAVEAVYFFEGAPVLARGGLGALLLPTAHAHPGHYSAGDALGEVRGLAAFDLLAPPAGLAPGEGVTGRYRSARVVLGEAPLGPAGAVATLLLEGVASRSGRSVAFRAAVPRAALGESPVIEGCPFEETAVAGDGIVSLAVDAALWLDQVDFADAPEAESTSQGPVSLAGTLAERALVRGLKKGAAYRFSFSPPPPR